MLHHLQHTHQYPHSNIILQYSLNHWPGNANKSNGLLRPSQQMEHISKSTSDIRTKPKIPYVYTKPKPMNIQRLMRQLASQSKSSPSSSSPSNKPVTTSKVAATTAGKTAKPKPKSNITYNFVRAPAPGKLKAANSTLLLLVDRVLMEPQLVLSINREVNNHQLQYDAPASQQKMSKSIVPQWMIYLVGTKIILKMI